MALSNRSVLKLLPLVLSCIYVSQSIASNDDDDNHRRSTHVTLIHMGDLHGHTIPRPNLRSDGDGRMEGGLARMYTKIKEIRENAKHTLLINTGDTIQGSGEALYTHGKALVDVIDLFGVDAFAPGNWEFVYGPDRFKAFFQNGRWGAMAANLYNTDPAAPVPTLAREHTQAEYDAWAQWYLDNGTRILPPYTIKKFGDIKIGIIGCTTRRGPQVVGRWVVEGIEFTDCANEVIKYTAELRDPNGHNVNLVVLITEIEVGANIQMVRTLLDDAHHVDFILNSDMHEETLEPIEILNKDGVRKTMLIEEGSDGTMIGELKLKFKNGVLSKWKFKPHRIHEGIKENKTIAKKVAQVRAPFTTAFDSSIPCNEDSPYYNTFSGTCLKGSLDTIVGETIIGLHRSNYSDEAMPAVIEGTSHDFIADAIRWWAKADLATVRGFRYGTHVKPGPITRNDLYHFIPIGARVGKASSIHVGQLRNQLDNSSQAVFSSDPMSALVRPAPYNNNGWAGGWMFAYSGDQFSVKFDPYWFRTAPADSRARELKVAMPCNRLPVTEQFPDCTGTQITQITNGTNGAFMPGWSAVLSTTVTTYALQTDPVPAGKKAWNFIKGTASRQNQLPTMSVSGYWYEQSPLTLNNCPNCNPLGTSNDDTNTNAPYLLPVNVGPNGEAMLYADGKPKLMRMDGSVIDDLSTVTPGDILRDEQDRPIVAGDAIELVEIIEKYLAATGPANPVQHRITLTQPLPGREVFGHPVMQPLCGTIPREITDENGNVIIVPAPMHCPDQ